MCRHNIYIYIYMSDARTSSVGLRSLVRNGGGYSAQVKLDVGPLVTSSRNSRAEKDAEQHALAKRGSTKGRPSDAMMTQPPCQRGDLSHRAAHHMPPTPP